MRATVLFGAAVAALVWAGTGRAQQLQDPSARVVEAGPKGGFYCLRDDEVAETAQGKHRATLSGLGPTCTRIEPYTKVVTLATRDTPTAVVGVARIEGVGTVAFALYRANQ